MTADPRLLAAAQAGDEEAFVRLTSAERPRMHRHCYRILGSLHDADDACQEAMLRAWRGLAGYSPQRPLGAWLTRIATNVCLRMIETRGRTPVPIAVDAHLEPYPDSLLGPDPARDPHQAVAEREDIGLAFVAAMQLLPAVQRTVLLLRDVLGYSARETAEEVGLSVAAANSALQRARARLEQERGQGTAGAAHRPSSTAVERDVMRRFQDAWAAMDFTALVALLSDDALLSMPPEGMRFRGSRAIGEFFATVPLEGRLDRIPLVPARANGQPALAAYADEDQTGVHDAYGVMVFAIDGDRIASITGFPRRPDLFTRLGLPTRLGDAPATP